MIGTCFISACVRGGVRVGPQVADWFNNHKIFPHVLEREPVFCWGFKTHISRSNVTRQVIILITRSAKLEISKVHVHTRCIFLICGVYLFTWRNCGSLHRLSTVFWRIDGSAAWIPPCSQTALSVRKKIKHKVRQDSPKVRSLNALVWYLLHYGLFLHAVVCLHTSPGLILM